MLEWERSGVDLEGIIVGGERHKHDKVHCKNLKELMKMYFISKCILVNDRTVDFLIRPDRQKRS